jgi:glycosyltransferase involved in cell wall biosynthesis
MRNKVSVIMSAYNASDYISETIESILNQSFKNFEFIIIDDGSTDSTLEIIHSFQDERIKCVNRENKGLTYSLNEAIDLATGNFICRQDADDTSHVYRLEKQLAFIESEGADVVFCQSYDGENILPKRYMVGSDITLGKLSFGNVLTHGTAFFKSSILKENRYNLEWKVGQDYELWLHLLKKGYKLKLLREPLYNLFRHKNSISSKRKEEQEQSAIKAVSIHFGRQARYMKHEDGRTKKLFKSLHKLVIR